MLHQKIPLYEGGQPFLYACYCADDDALVFPILAKMYNEGFRIWSAAAGGVNADFRSAQRMNSSACVMLFLSANALERLRAGDPELTAAARSAMLHIVVQLDDCEISNKLFALAVPDKLEFKSGNDSPYWLYVYSSDLLEKCRGRWPEKKLVLHEATFEEASDNIEEEYQKLSSIMSGNSKPAKKHTEQREIYKNNEGYIPPEPDNYVYAPIDKVKAAKSELDKDFDAVVDLIGKYVEAQEAIIDEHSVAAEDNSGSFAPWDAKWVDDTSVNKEPPQLVIDSFPTGPEKYGDRPSGPKADRVITPEPISAPSVESFDAPEVVYTALPEESLNEAVDDTAIDISDTDSFTPVEDSSASAFVTTLFPGDTVVFERITNFVEYPTEESPAPAEQPLLEQSLLEQPVQAETVGQTVVPVIARRQQQGVKVTPVMYRRARPAAPARERADILPASISTSSDFEEYVRSIAMTAVNAAATQTAAEPPSEEPPATARKHRSRGSAPAAEQPIAIQSESADAAAATTADFELPEGMDEAEALKTAVRKSRFPHKHGAGLLSNLMRVLHHSAAEPSPDIAPDETAAESTAECTVESSPEPQKAALPDISAETMSDRPAKAGPAKPRRSASRLQDAVDNFVAKDTKLVSVVQRRK